MPAWPILSRSIGSGAVIVALGCSPLVAQTRDGAIPPLIADGPMVMEIWSTETPERRQRFNCTIAGTSLNCPFQFEVGPSSVNGALQGTIQGLRIEGTTSGTIVYHNAVCPYAYATRSAFTIDLVPDGTLVNRTTDQVSEQTSASGPCAASLPKRSTSPDVTMVGTWNQPSPLAGMKIVVLAPDGKAVTIDLEEWKAGKLTVEQMDLVRQFELKPPSGGAPYTLRAWRYPAPSSRQPPLFVPMQRLDEAIIEGAQSAAAWVKANPGRASLAALGLAVSIAMPYTAAFQASAAGMTFLESAGIGFMTAATPAAVQTLVTSATAGEGFWKSGGKAALSGAVAGAESLIGTAAGAGVTGAVETGAALTQRLVGARISEEAVRGFGAVASGMAGSATDLGVGILHDRAADAIAGAAGKTAIPDLVPPVRPTRAGGIVLPILQRPDTAR